MLAAAFAGNDGVQDVLACAPTTSSNPLVSWRFICVSAFCMCRTLLATGFQEHPALTPQCTQRTHRLGWASAPLSKP